MSELQNASCGCVRAHEQPSVSWLTCRLLKTNSRLIRCWYTDCISPNFFFSPLCCWNKVYGVRLDPLRSPRTGRCSGRLRVKCPSLRSGCCRWCFSPRLSVFPPDPGEAHSRTYSAPERRPSPPLQLAGGAANQRPVMPLGITDRMTDWNFTLLRLIFPD